MTARTTLPGALQLHCIICLSEPRHAGNSLKSARRDKHQKLICTSPDARRDIRIVVHLKRVFQIYSDSDIPPCGARGVGEAGDDAFGAGLRMNLDIFHTGPARQ